MLKLMGYTTAAWFFMVSATPAMATEALEEATDDRLAGDVVLTVSTVYQVPFGLSQSDAFSVPAVDTSAGKLRVKMDGATCGASATSVRYTSAFNQAAWQTMAPEQDGSFRFTGSRIYYLQFDVTQSTYAYGLCTYRVVVGGGTDGGNEGELIGVIQYGGGFAQRLPIALNPSALIKSFRVAIPEFCGGTEILEAGTISEGTFDRAAAVRQPGTFNVNDGAGLRVSAIEVSFNGPSTSACAIPVYVVR